MASACPRRLRNSLGTGEQPAFRIRSLEGPGHSNLVVQGAGTSAAGAISRPILPFAS